MSLETLRASRDQIIENEAKRFLGGSLTLSTKERLANTVLMEAKHREYDDSIAKMNFPPAVNFFQSKPTMLQSKVFQFIQQMPKGF